MKSKILQFVLILLSSFYCLGQTSLHTEITRIDLPKDYKLKNGLAKEITVSKRINPGQEYSYSEKIKYTFPEQRTIRTKRYEGSELKSTREFVLDTLARIIKNTVRFKHKSLGWRVSKTETFYGDNFKVLNILNQDGSLNYMMKVVFDDFKHPIEISTLNINNQLISRSTAEYDYENYKFVYKVYNRENAIVLNNTEPFRKDYEIKRNQFGDLVEFYWPTSNSDTRYLVEYKYDDKGNWTKLKKILIEGERKVITEIKVRKIKYLKN